MIEFEFDAQVMQQFSASLAAGAPLDRPQGDWDISSLLMLAGACLRTARNQLLLEQAARMAKHQMTIDPDKRPPLEVIEASFDRTRADTIGAAVFCDELLREIENGDYQRGPKPAFELTAEQETCEVRKVVRKRKSPADGP